jgi:hypothetical protein
VALDEHAGDTALPSSKHSDGKAPWSGDDDTRARIGRFLDRLGLIQLRHLDAGSSTLEPLELTVGMPAFDTIRHAADTELGHTYRGKDGKVTHRSRSDHIR